MEEKYIKCRCCGGLCPGHGAIARGEAKMPDNRNVPGCWECCGSGCRACGNSGKISLERAMTVSDARIDRLMDEINTKQRELGDEQLRNEFLHEWADGGSAPEEAVL